MSYSSIFSLGALTWHSAVKEFMPTMKQDTIWLTMFPNHSTLKPLNKRFVLSNDSWFLSFYVDICRRCIYLCKSATLVYLYIILRTRVMWFGRSSAVHGVAKGQRRLRDWTELNWTCPLGKTHGTMSNYIFACRIIIYLLKMKSIAYTLHIIILYLKKEEEYYFKEKNEAVRRGCFEGEVH